MTLTYKVVFNKKFLTILNFSYKLSGLAY